MRPNNYLGFHHNILKFDVCTSNIRKISLTNDAYNLGIDCRKHNVFVIGNNVGRVSQKKKNGCFGSDRLVEEMIHLNVQSTN